MNENIIKAAQTADLLCRDLQAALKSAEASLESQVVFWLIEEAAQVRNQIDLLRAALEFDAKWKK